MSADAPIQPDVPPSGTGCASNSADQLPATAPTAARHTLLPMLI